MFGHEVWKGALGPVHSLNNWSTECEESSTEQSQWLVTQKAEATPPAWAPLIFILLYQ